MNKDATQPTFRTIAELFQVPIGDVELIEEPESPKLGRTADESDQLGKAALVDGNYQRAIVHFQRACDQRGHKDISSQINLAGALEYADQAPQALRHYLRALEIEQDALEPQLGISDVLKRYGRFRESIAHLQEAAHKEPSNPFVHLKLAETLKEAGHPHAALIAAQGAVAAKPDDAFYHYWTGDLLISLGEYDKALDSLRAAIELSPGDDFLYLRACVAFWGANRRPEALKSLRLASDLDPEKNLYHGLIGVLLEENGLLDEARLESDRANKMDRYDQDMLGRLMDEMGIEP